MWHRAACRAGGRWLESQLHHFLPAGPCWCSFCEPQPSHLHNGERGVPCPLSAVAGLALTDFSSHPLFPFSARECPALPQAPRPPVTACLAAGVEP